MIVWRLLLLVTLTVWLNQSVSVNRYGELRDRIERGEASWTLTVQQPVLFAYRRAYDEELYCALSARCSGVRSIMSVCDRCARTATRTSSARRRRPMDVGTRRIVRSRWSIRRW